MEQFVADFFEKNQIYDSWLFKIDNPDDYYYDSDYTSLAIINMLIVIDQFTQGKDQRIKELFKRARDQEDIRELFCRDTEQYLIERVLCLDVQQEEKEKEKEEK